MKLLDISLKGRRSTRIALRVPVKIGIRKSNATLDAHTTIINKNGARLECELPIDSMQEVVISTHTGKTAIGQVIWAGTRPNFNGNFEFAIGLNQPANLFGVTFPPEDWIRPELAEWSVFVPNAATS